MTGRRGQRRGDPEAGISVVEALVTIMLLGVGVLAVVGTLGAAARASALGDHRAVASGVAGDELEGLRALTYEQVGIATASAGYVVRHEGRDTVTETVNRVQPLGQRTVDGITYDIRRHVTWAAVDVGASRVARAYKHLTVIVTWTDAGRVHSVRLDSGRNQGATGG